MSENATKYIVDVTKAAPLTILTFEQTPESDLTNLLFGFLVKGNFKITSNNVFFGDYTYRLSTRDCTLYKSELNVTKCRKLKNSQVRALLIGIANYLVNGSGSAYSLKGHNATRGK